MSVRSTTLPARPAVQDDELILEWRFPREKSIRDWASGRSHIDRLGSNVQVGHVWNIRLGLCRRQQFGNLTNGNRFAYAS